MILSWLLLPFLICTWCLVMVASAAAKGAECARKGLARAQWSGVSLIPELLFPFVLWGIALAVNAFASPWGTWVVGGSHVALVPWLVISLAGSIRAVHRWHRQDRRYACPCCGHITLWQRGAFELCEVCWWVDDSQDDEDVATVRGGPNGSLSLAGGRYNVRHVGACEACFVDRVRAPRAGESRTGDAKG